MLPKTAGSAKTHKSISFIWIVWSTLYVYLWVHLKPNGHTLAGFALTPFVWPQQHPALPLLEDSATLNVWWHEIIPLIKTYCTPSILHNFIHSCLYTVEVKGDILPHHKRPIWGNERRPIRRLNTSQIMRICLLLCTSMALTDLLRLQTRKTFFGLKSFSYGHLTSRFKLRIRFIWWFYYNMNCQSHWVSMYGALDQSSKYWKNLRCLIRTWL